MGRLQVHILHKPTVHPGRMGGYRITPAVPVPRKDLGEDDLPEDHLHQACQEDRVCPEAPKNKQKNHQLQ